MFLQQLSNQEDLPGSKAEFTLDLWAIIVGCLYFVAVVLGALRVVTIVVVVEALSITVGFVLVGCLIDFPLMSQKPLAPFCALLLCTTCKFV